MAISSPISIWRQLLGALLATLMLYAPAVLQAEEHRPGVAVFPFRAVLHSAAPHTLKARADLLSALLTTRLAESDQIVVLDRTQLEALFAEQPLLLGQGKSDSGQSLLPTLPLSEYTVTGTVFTEEGRDRLSVRVVRNSNGEVLGILRSVYKASLPSEVIDIVSTWIDALINEHGRANQAVAIAADRRIAFGNFECLSDDAKCHSYAGSLSNRLTENYLPYPQYRIVARTQLVPLVLEDILRNSQQIASMDTIQGRGARYLIHGKLRNNGAGQSKSLYLYLEDVEQERTLKVLTASDWESLFSQANEAIREYFLLPRSADLAVIKDSRQTATAEAVALFLQALKKLQVVGENVTSFSGLTPYQFKGIAYKGLPEPRRAEALALIERSLERDADYLPALIAKAIVVAADGDTGRSQAILQRVANSKDPAVERTAFDLLKAQWHEDSSDIGPHLFEDIVAKSKAAEIVNQLREQGYLVRSNGRLQIKSYLSAYRIINQTHLLTLNGVPADIAIRIFERLRAMIHTQGVEVRFITPKGYHPRELKNFRAHWPQSLFHGRYGRESVMLRELGKGSADIAVAQLGETLNVPSIHYGDDTTSAGRLENGIDGFASSVFVEPTNLQSLVLLGHSLCAEVIGQCLVGGIVNTWVIDYTNRAYPDRRHGGLVNRANDEDDVDGLIFIAATAVDALEQANLTALARAMDYYKEGLRSVNQRRARAGDLTGNQLKQAVAEHARGILTACRQMVEFRPHNLRSLRRIEKYLEAMNSLAQLAKEDERARVARSQELARVEHECREGYPYLVLAMQNDAEFLAREQDEMVARVLEGEITPALVSQFVEYSIVLFERRVDSGRLDAAKAYIRHYEHYHGISAETALDFAYLYHRVNDSAAAEKVIRDYGRDRFELSGYTITAINGSYAADGFDEQGRLLYRNQSNGHVLLRYQGEHLKYAVGMKPIKWSLTLTRPSGKERRFSGNRNSKHPDKFCFDNDGEITGDIRWPLQDEAQSTPPAATAVAVPTPIVMLQPISTDESVAPMLQYGHVPSAGHGYAIKGYSYGYAAGPLLPSHFPKPLAASRDINALIEKLFTLDYLTVSGVPQIKPHTIYERIKQDFTELEEYERRYLREAIVRAGKKSGAGYAEIHRWEETGWQLQTTLSAADAEQHRGFGHAVSLTDNYAFVCDRTNGLYVFQRNDDGWQQQQRLSSPCRSVANSDHWAVTQAPGRLDVFINDGIWRQHQTLYPHNHLLRENQGRRFEYFGEALVLDGETLFVGDPLYSGGDVTLYKLMGGQWQEAELLTNPPSSIRFGKSLAAGAGHLIVGADEKPFDLGGQALVYKSGADGWQLDTKLMPQDGGVREFAKGLWLSADQPRSLYIQSNGSVYRHTLPLPVSDDAENK